MLAIHFQTVNCSAPALNRVFISRKATRKHPRWWRARGVRNVKKEESVTNLFHFFRFFKEANALFLKTFSSSSDDEDDDDTELEEGEVFFLR